MKDLLFKGFFLIAPKAAWWILAGLLFATFYESVFASNHDGVTEIPSIIGIAISFLGAAYSVYYSLKSEK